MSGCPAGPWRTWNHIARIHGILVLNEAKTVHELDLGDLARAMGREVGLHVRLGGIAGEVAQVEARRRDFGHDGDCKPGDDDLALNPGEQGPQWTAAVKQCRNTKDAEANRWRMSTNRIPDSRSGCAAV